MRRREGRWEWVRRESEEAGSQELNDCDKTGRGGEMAYRGREMKERKGEGKGGVNDRGLVGRWSRTWREE